MIESLAIDNYKCFKKLRLSKLKRFNVVVGRNAGGKTALLEALFMLAGSSPQIALKVRTFRGMGEGLTISHERTGFEALWRDLFFDFDQKKPIQLEAIGTDNNSRSLSIFYGDPENVTLPFGTQAAEQVDPWVSINFRYVKSDGKAVLVQPALNQAGLTFGPSVESFPAIFLTPVYREPATENGKRFSELSKVGAEGSLVEAVRAEFPFITDLSVEYHSGAAQVHASLRSGSEKIPLPLISDGVNKLVSILLAIRGFAGGIVLIDEIENGLYFDIMTHVSGSILAFAQQHQTQLFMTTHSKEYLRSLLPLAEKYPDEFCLLRTTKDNGSSDVDEFDGRQFVAALEEGFEIR